MIKIKLIQVLRNDKELTVFKNRYDANKYIKTLPKYENAMFNSFMDVEAPKPSKVKYKYSTREIEVNIFKYFIVDLFGGYK